MNNTAILDFDGTIFSEGVIDLGLLEEISSRYQKILLVSNNSSIAHTDIESYLFPYSKYILTPQVLAKAILQNSSIETEICCSKDVFNYLQSDFYSSNFEIRDFLEQVSVNSSNLFLAENRFKKIAIIGKINSVEFKKVVNEYLLQNYVLVGMNKDKFTDSKGIFKDTNLVGDSYEFKYELGKTSFTFLQLIKNYCIHFNLNTVAVYGDNSQSDGKLAYKLGIKYERTIFGKSKFSRLISTN